MVIRKASIEDVPNIVNIHISAFPNFFLTSLGQSFLIFYYKCFINSSLGVVLCFEDNNEIQAFSATSLTNKGFNKKLIMDNVFSFLILTIKLVFSSPKSLLRLINNLNKKNKNDVVELDYAELFSIAVNNDMQGKGFGKKILFTTEKYLRDKNIDKISLTTDFYDNESTICFYKSMGYEVLYEFIAYPNRKMYRFIKNI